MKSPKTSEFVQQNRIVTFNEMRELLGGVGRSTLYGYINEGFLPERVRIGNKAKGWRQEDIRQLMEPRRTDFKRRD